jgi:hypothetical protein
MGGLDSYHIEDFFFSRKQSVKFTDLDEDKMADIKHNGIRIYLFCDGIVDEMASLINTMLLYMGGLTTNPNLPIIGSHVPEYMEKANVAFINESMGWSMETR